MRDLHSLILTQPGICLEGEIAKTIRLCLPAIREEHGQRPDHEGREARYPQELRSRPLPGAIPPS